MLQFLSFMYVCKQTISTPTMKTRIKMPIGFWSVILGAMCVISCGENRKDHSMLLTHISNSIKKSTILCPRIPDMFVPRHRSV